MPGCIEADHRFLYKVDEQILLYAVLRILHEADERILLFAVHRILHEADEQILLCIEGESK